MSRFLGGDYQIEATLGHVRDLPKNKLAIDIENNFKPEYAIVPERQKEIDNLKEKAEKAKSIILATDPDREGEAIAWHVTVLIRGTQNYDRIVFHEITEQAVKDALANPREIDMKLVHAQQARRVLDRLVGYKLSPLLWRKIRRGLSAGRVQSVTVRLIVEREREIEAFKPEEYWKIEAELLGLPDSPHPSPDSFLATLISRNGQKIEIKNKMEADKILAELEGVPAFKVKDIKTEEVRKFPFPPFTTSTMQQAASILFGWASKRTMQVAQNLYEQGLITYHRTDSVNLAKQAITACRNYIASEYGKNYLPETPRIYKTKSKVAQEAHEAIRPTDIRYKILDIRNQYGRDGAKLYGLIWKRMVACQMKEAIFEETKVEIEADSFLFRTIGSQLKFEGWKKVYSDDRETEKKLPSLKIGELLKLLRLLPSQHFTEPPPRYTEATLIKALEEKGIGRPSTYAPIISTIQERQYVEKIERKFAPTVLGITVNDFLVDNFSDIVNVDFTAKMEDELDEIANGKIAWAPVISEFYGPFEKVVTEVQEKAKRVEIPVEETDEKCDKCGAPLVIRIGKFGKFLACSRFPECDFTKTLVNKTGLTCPNCRGEIVIKKTRRGRSFYGCINYPNCKFAAWKKEQIAKIS